MKSILFLHIFFELINSQGKIKKKKKQKKTKNKERITHGSLLLLCFLSCLIKLLLKSFLERFHFPSYWKHRTQTSTQVTIRKYLFRFKNVPLVIQSSKQMYFVYESHKLNHKDSMTYSAGARQKLPMMQSSHCLYLLNGLLCTTSASASFLTKMIGTEKVRKVGKWKSTDIEKYCYQ